MKHLFVVCMVVCSVVAGCARPAEEPVKTEEPAATVEWERALPGLMTETQYAQQELILTATNALASELLGELTAALDSGDADAAIAVCRSKVRVVAAHVSEAYGVDIGRTSYWLRNPANVPPEWAHPYVETMIEEPTYVAGPNGELGALLPIKLKAECQMCHGQVDEIDEGIAAALAEHYPGDQAVGFAEGDLRGWFWVEAPPGEAEPAESEM